MAIPNSGTIKLRGTIGAEWGYSGSSARLNGSFGGYISKSAGAKTKMSDFYGKSAFTAMTVTVTGHTSTWDSGNMRYYKFENGKTGNWNIRANPNSMQTTVFMVGGGGGGGVHGAGGGGGEVYNGLQTWGPNDMNTSGFYVFAGAGGAGLDSQPMTWTPTYGQGKDGEWSILQKRQNNDGSGNLRDYMKVQGGGGGGGRKSTGLDQNMINGRAGGCGGGGTAWYGDGIGASAGAGSHGRGGNGIDSSPFVAGGGGGARGDGGDAVVGNNGFAGRGGTGYQCPLDGNYYAGGGGGGVMRSYRDVGWIMGAGGSGGGGGGGQPYHYSQDSRDVAGGNGAAHTGGGGGGGGGNSSWDTNSGGGGTGAIILGYQFKQ